MTHIWTVTTGWDDMITCGVTFAFDNEVSARTIAHEIDTARMKYEAALEARATLFATTPVCADGEIDWAKYNQNRDYYPLPPDEYVLEASGQKIQVADHTVIQGPVPVLS